METQKFSIDTVSSMLGSLIGGIVYGGHASASQVREAVKNLAEDDVTWQILSSEGMCSEMSKLKQYLVETIR